MTRVARPSSWRDLRESAAVGVGPGLPVACERERVAEDLECPRARGRDREAIARAQILDDDEQLVAARVPEEGDVEVVVPAVRQLGHLDPSFVALDRGSRMRRDG